MEHEGDSDTNYSRCTSNGLKRLRKKDWRNWNSEKNLDNSDNSIVKKTVRILRSVLDTWEDLLSVSCQKPPANAAVKNSQRIISE